MSQKNPDEVFWERSGPSRWCSGLTAGTEPTRGTWQPVNKALLSASGEGEGIRKRQGIPKRGISQKETRVGWGDGSLDKWAAM